MSEFKCEVVKVGKIVKHGGADTLGMTNVWQYPCIVKLGELNEGDLAVYIPVDAVVDTTRPEFAFLGRHPRIKAKKLRGVFSMGMLIKAPADAKVGDDFASYFNIKKWEEPDPAVSHNGNLKTGGDCEKVPFFYVNYDVSHLRRYTVSLQPMEEVVVTEKIHGCNSRFVWYEEKPGTGMMYCGSHNTWKKPGLDNLWWKVAKQYSLAEKLARYPNHIFYGETYGWVQDLRYGHNQGEVSIAFFDIFDLKNGKWLDFNVMTSICKDLGLPYVPVLYLGPWHEDLAKTYVDGLSVLGNNMREGVVVRPVTERFDQYCGRPVLKLVSEKYLLREGGTEKH